MIRILLLLSFIGRVVLLLQFLSLNKYGQMTIVNPYEKGLAPCPNDPYVCTKTMYKHVIDRIYE